MKPLDVMTSLGKMAIVSSIRYTKGEIIDIRNSAYCCLHFPGHENFLRSSLVGYTDQEVEYVQFTAPTALRGAEDVLKLIRTKH